MKKDLSDKIKFYLRKNNSIEVSFCPHHKGCDITLEKNKYLLDFDFFYNHFQSWWYDELCDLLMANDVYADSIDVEFELNEELLLANVILNSSDGYYCSDKEQHSKNEIVTPLLVSTLINHLKLSEPIFHEELIEFQIAYDGTFNLFNIYYDDEKIKLNKKETDKLQLETATITSDWTGTFFGENESNHTVYITIEPYDDLFECTDIVNYQFEIDPNK